MAIKRLRGMGRVGVVNDLVNTDLPVNALTDALNVRFEGVKIEGIGGWDVASTQTCIQDQIPYLTATTGIQLGQYFLATDKCIYSIYNNENYDPTVAGSTQEIRFNVTPVDVRGVNYPSYDTHLPSGATKMRDYAVDPIHRWTSTIVAGRVVFNTKTQDPIGQKDGGDVKAAFETLPGWGVPNSAGTNADVKVTWRARNIHAYKNYLMALNMDEAVSFASPATTTNIGNRIRWSNYAFNNQLPQDWYEDKEDSDGGFVDLMDATSPIVDGRPLRDDFMVYTNTETYVVRFTGGTEVFQNYKLFSDSGILSDGCVADLGGRHLVVTKDDVIIHDGSQKNSVIDGILKNRLIKELSSVNAEATRVYHNPVRSEVWICYPYSAYQSQNLTLFTCNRAAVFNYNYGTWTFADLPDIYSIGFVDVFNTDLNAPWETGSPLINTSLEWEALSLPWNTSTLQMGNKMMVAPSASHALFALDATTYETTLTFSDTTTFTKAKNPMERFVERLEVDFDEEVDYPNLKTLRTIYPVMEGSGDYLFVLGSKNVIGGASYSKPPQSYTTGQSWKVDTFTTGRYINYRIESTGESDWKLNGLDFDFIREGTR